MSNPLPIGAMGWALDKENIKDLEANGCNTKELLAQAKDVLPPFNSLANPKDIVNILDQRNQGACQGHALAMMFSICFFLKTGRWYEFSRAAGYYLSQRYDGIRGDSGSTLSAGRKVATDHGMCLERDWPYPSSYNPREPSGIDYPYKIKVTQPIRDIEIAMEWLSLGLPIQTGTIWGNNMSKELVTQGDTRGGGHSTSLWLLTIEGYVRNLNSWGGSWNGDGVHQWTKQAFAGMLANQNNVFIGYAPDDMEYPIPDVI